MELFLKFDVSFFSILMLVVLFTTIKLRREPLGTSSKLFFRFLWITIFLLVLEIFTWMFDGVAGMNSANYFLNFMFAWCTSISTCVLAAYIDYHMFGSYDRIRKRWYYLYPFIVTGILLIVNFYVPIIFSVSPDNIYSREKYMVLLPIINLCMFSYILKLAYVNRKKINKEVIYVLLLYITIPAVGAFLQVIYYGVFILWPLMSVTVVLTYIFLETVSTSKDYLTGLMSRHRVDGYIDYMIDHSKPFMLVMIDIDKFKYINDTFGHTFGDTVLKSFSKVLQKKFKHDKVVGRYAGDEFILVLEKTSVENLKIIFDEIGQIIDDLIIESDVDFVMSFSYGYCLFEYNSSMKYKDIVKIADEMMYSNKRRKTGKE